MGEIAPEGAPTEGEPAVEEAAWTGPSREEWESTVSALQALTPLAEQWREWQEQPPEEEAPAGEGLDPFSESFQAQLDRYLDQKLAPVQNYTNEQQMAEAEERAMDIITDLETREGEFLFEQSKPLARELANRYIGEAQQKFGFGPKAAEAALERAYKDVRAWEEEVGQAYHERQVNQLSTLGQARQEPGAAGTASAEQVGAFQGTERDLVRKYFPPVRG